MPNRTVCEVLQEMRAAYNSRNFAGLLGLIEETQSMVNRMEAALQDQKNIKEMASEKKELKKELKFLEIQITNLESKKDKLINGLDYDPALDEV